MPCIYIYLDDKNYNKFKNELKVTYQKPIKDKLKKTLIIEIKKGLKQQKQEQED